MLRTDSIFTNYLIILFTPLPWLVIILWHLILGLTVLFIAKAFSKGELKCKSIFAMTGLYIGFGFCVEMLKGVVYFFIEILYGWYVNNTVKTDLTYKAHKTIYSLWHSGFDRADVLLMVFSVFSTIGFGLLIYFFVMRKAEISKRLKIITSIILSVFSGAFYILYL